MYTTLKTLSPLRLYTSCTHRAMCGQKSGSYRTVTFGGSLPYDVGNPDCGNHTLSFIKTWWGAWRREMSGRGGPRVHVNLIILIN